MRLLFVFAAAGLGLGCGGSDPGFGGCPPTDPTCQDPPPLVIPPRAAVSLFDYDHTAPLGYQEFPATSPMPGVTLSAVSFASPAGGQATGWLAVPDAPGPHPGVVLLHGLPGTGQQMMAADGLEFARRGAVALALDAPWARRGTTPDFTPQDSVDQVQLMLDLRRAVDVLTARADVAPDRLGYVGGSYGGAMGGLFVAIEKRLRAAVLFVPDGGLVSHWTSPGGVATGPLAAQPPAARERWLAAMWPIEPIRFIGESSPTELLFQNGRFDQLVAAEDAEAVHAEAGDPKTILWYQADHGLTAQARTDRYTWLATRLGLLP